MRIVVQRVSGAWVDIDGERHASIGTGLLILLGIEKDDGAEDIQYLASKICALRIFSDSDQKMNLDITQVNGELLVVSQFTLHASTKRGNRPSFIRAAGAETAIPLYQAFVRACEAQLGKPCKTGVFGAHMKVSLTNDGPVTIIIDSRNRE